MTLFSNKALKYGVSLLLLLFIGVLLFVYVKVTKGPDCFVSDQPYKLSTNLIDGSQYSIYAVISGFHEKSQVFYLLEEPVSFDECGYFEKIPGVSASPEIEINLKSVSEVEVQGTSKIEFKYAEGAIALEDIKVQWLPGNTL